jgi:predicted phage terminase large subunit-like protein
MIITPQKGPQEDFLSTPADIAVFGGAAGAGKSYALLMEPLRHVHNPKFGAVFFRRETPQLTAEGGIWDTSYDLYLSQNGRPVTSPKLQWTFPSKAKITFSHLQHEKTVKSWDSSQIALLGFDELQQFEESQFFYMLSRNRSLSGVAPYIRGGCNPDPDSFLRDFLSWWIDQETGYPDYSRYGILRWMVRIDNTIRWSSNKEKLIKEFGPGSMPKSVTFIPGKVTDNVILMEGDPGYIANLKALPEYEKLRLFGGNWFARPSAGDLFKRHYFKLIDREDLPTFELEVRYWDRAATEPSDVNKDPDYTSGLRMGVDRQDNYYVLDLRYGRTAPKEVEDLVKGTAEHDGRGVVIGLEQEPGASGVMEVDYFIRLLSTFAVEKFPKTIKKLTAWKPVSAQAKAGNVYVVRAPWNEVFFNQLEGVTDGSQKGHDDHADTLAGAFNYLSLEMSKNRGPTYHKKKNRITSAYRKKVW